MILHGKEIIKIAFTCIHFLLLNEVFCIFLPLLVCIYFLMLYDVFCCLKSYFILPLNATKCTSVPTLRSGFLLYCGVDTIPRVESFFCEGCVSNSQCLQSLRNYSINRCTTPPFHIRVDYICKTYRWGPPICEKRV